MPEVVVSGNVINATVTSPGVNVSAGGSSIVSASVPGQTSIAAGIVSQTPQVLSVNGQAGNVVIPVRPLSPQKADEVVWFSCTRDVSVSVYAQTTTGYAAVMWWDGSVQVFGTGGTASYIALSKSVPPSGAYSRTSPKQVYVWSCVSPTDATRSGSVVAISCQSVAISAISVAGCGQLQQLLCDSNDISLLDISRCPSLWYLSCGQNRLTSLDLSATPSLSEVYCQSNLLSRLDVDKLPNLTVLQCSSNSLTSLDVSTNTLLRSLVCSSNSLTELQLSQNKGLTYLNCTQNLLTLVRAEGVRLYGFFGGILTNNQLSGVALNRLYSDLLPSPGARLYVGFNPGVTADDPSIAAAKGYTVYGT